MDEHVIAERLRISLSEDRFIHIIGAVDVAVALAKLHGVDESKAKLAALLHDCAREFSVDQMLEIASRHNIMLDEVSMRETVLLHGPLGAKIAEEIYSVKDKEVLNAIDCHTTGKENMSKLEKIIFIADYIEPGRHFEKVLQLRQKAMEDLNSSVLMALDITILELLQNKRLIHPRTMEARNFMILTLDATL